MCFRKALFGLALRTTSWRSDADFGLLKPPLGLSIQNNPANLAAAARSANEIAMRRIGTGSRCERRAPTSDIRIAGGAITPTSINAFDAL